MKKNFISFVFPSIRPYNVTRLYKSIRSATDLDFELILVGPYDLPHDLQQYSNIRTIRDFGSAVRAQHLGVYNACGEFVMWGVDDGVFLPHSIDKVLQEFNQMDSEKKAITCKYYEGVNRDNLDSSPTDHLFIDDNYYVLNFHPATRSACVPDHWHGINHGFLYTRYAQEMGLYDCRFETVDFAMADFAVRSQRDGCLIKVSQGPVLKCGWMPGTTGDHAPVDRAHHENGKPLYDSIVCDDNRIKIDINNWMSAPAVWERRFGKR